MKIINSGSAEIKLSINGKIIALKENDSAEIDPRTFIALHRIFPALVADCPKAEAKAEEKVIIEAEAKPIETKKRGRKNGTSKKSK